MAITMMLIAAVISIVFLVDFARTISDLKRDRVAMKDNNRNPGGFGV
ncbi:hypothetical protein JNB71_01435 [Rhizobium herbae]|uniref:Uncharacterized protein n=1 Tax=Rhizobium herbae TaxID=508661 RepID=A0ABS7H604_9HYPH|nr:hypothetical protein [Rhizobium herbae]MBW9061967.1 hypothetical protein [Rhizobium herbae]